MKIEDMKIEEDFDEDFYEKQIPEVMGYYSGSEYTKRQRYYHHYINYGQSLYKNLKEYEEKLLDNYKSSFELDKNFDPKLYRIYNSDLATMSDSQVTLHYLLHGKKEGRVFYTGESYSKLMEQDEKNLDKKYQDCVILINHDVSLTGAPIFLYDLYDFIVENNYFSKVVMLEPYPNDILPNIDKLYHFNNKEKLMEILEDLSPTLIYSNSLNLMLLNLSYSSYWVSKTIFHLHETYEPFYNYVEKNFDLTKLTIKVVSEKIKKEYLSKQSFSNITIFPPFIATKKLKKIEKSSLEKCEIFSEQGVDPTKVIIGMSGSLCDRKNLLLFYQVAEECPEYEFLWIGGKDLNEYLKKNNIQKKLNNFYWIPNTKNPYKYFEHMDYFFLTSLSDPCPIVILESLYLNKKIIVLKNNIHTNHDIKYLENYIEIDNSPNDSNLDIINKFKNLKLNKNKNITNKNKDYIKKNYSKPLISSRSEDKNFLICSIYIDDLDTKLDYFINLINQFNIRNKFSYKAIACLSFNEKLFSHIDNDCKIVKYLSKYLINHKILLRKNIGYDIGGLLDGIKHIYENFEVKENSKLAYTHSKSNKHWQNVNNEIFYIDDDASDTIVSRKFSVVCDLKDLNREIFKKHPEIFKFEKDEFEYIQGTVFRTNINFLKELYDKYEKIFPNLTNINKNDNYWIQIMSDEKIFRKYLHEYSDSIFNRPIDEKSHKIVSQGLAKNYIDLFENHNTRGIPDCQFEHALERYIGYLIFNKNLNKI